MKEDLDNLEKKVKEVQETAEKAEKRFKEIGIGVGRLAVQEACARV